MVFEVVSRKTFGIMVDYEMGDLARALGLGPTLWVYDISRMTGGVLFMVGAGYALMRGVHIRADFLYRNWSIQTQATVDATMYLMFYFPAMLFFFWAALDYSIGAFGNNIFEITGWEKASDTTWAPYVGPARIAMPLSALLLFMQGFPELFRSLYAMGKPAKKCFCDSCQSILSDSHGCSCPCSSMTILHSHH